MLKRMQDLDTGEVRIGASDMTLQFYLLPFLERFHEKYPKVKVTVSNGPTPETVGFLSRGTIDFGVVSSPVDARPEIKGTSLYFSGKEYEYPSFYGRLSGAAGNCRGTGI